MKKPVARVARPTMFECVCVCVCVEYEYIHEKTQLYRSVAFRYIWLPYAAHDWPRMFSAGRAAIQAKPQIIENQKCDRQTQTHTHSPE